MRPYILQVCILFYLITLTPSNSWGDEVKQILGFDECYQLALQASESLQISELDIKLAEGQYREALSGVYPQFKLGGSERIRDNASQGTASGANTIGGFVGSRNDRFDSYIRLNQPIFSGFRDILLIKASRLSIEAQEFDLIRARENLYSEVAEIYRQTALYKEDLEEIDASRAVLGKRIEEISRWIELGKSRESERLAARADLAELVATRDSTRGLYLAHQELLAFIINQQADSFEVKKLPRIEPNLALDTLLAHFHERSDIKAQLARQDSKSRELDAGKRERWPTVDLESNYYLQQSPETGREWDVNLNLSVPIFDSGRISARIAQKKAELKQSKLRLAEIKRTAERDVRSNFVQLKAAQDELKNLTSLVEISKENFEIQQRDYELGIVTNLEVLTARRQLLDAKRRTIVARSKIFGKRIDLIVASGELPK